ncbi:non-ribosomal peptide synthetase [Pseudomonas sp. H9]|uniref:non-ribosomal peptide synthetase n=1 Tax=Pseudomonas sp. H9 TaxID=483968 RepID=UPI001057899D|nr:non-ribosomal peptide synthetase [Pseudomonas sp. H9]TDF82584.1 amino acid adenylation domain-containing protein [Pseudomonas sp. H9]
MTTSNPSGEIFQTSAQQALALTAQGADARPGQAWLLLALTQVPEAEVLAQALHTLGERHEVLRTVYRRLPGMSWPVQAVLDQAPVRIHASAERDEALAWAREQVVGAGEVSLAVSTVAGPQPAVLLLGAAASLDRLTLLALARELRDLCEGRELADNDEELQYVDFAAWQQELREEDLGRQGTAFWQERLRTYQIPHRLAFETASDPGLARHRAQASSTLATEDQARVLTLWGAFLARISHLDRLLLGVEVDGRNEELDGAYGAFARSLPVAFDNRRSASLDELSAEVAASFELSRSWQDCLNEFELGLCRYGFALRSSALSAGVLALDVEAPTELLRLELADGQASLDARADAFEAAALQVLLGQFLTFADQALKAPTQDLGQATLLDAEARQAVLEGFNPQAASLPHARTLQSLFAEQALQYPQQMALSVGDERLTYAELDRLSNQVANTLRAQGTGPDQVVAVYGQRSRELVVALLGILKAGGAYLPLDPNYPAERLAFMLADAGATQVLASVALPDAWQQDAALTVTSLQSGSPVWSASTEAPAAVGEPGNLAYVIYTSGSTGKPKGVMVSHANAVASTLARGRFYREPLTNFLMLSSFSFDSSVAGVFWALSQGATLTLPDEQSHKDPQQLAALIAREGVSHYLTLPSFHAQILQNLEAPSLRCVIVAGEACAPEVLQRHSERLPGVALVNEYGPSEATVWSTGAYLDPLDRHGIAIGKPVDGLRVHLLDAQLEPVAVGLEGELHVAGDGLCRGYLQRPSLTAERFVPDPFAREPGQRLYRTGDLARYRIDGQIDYLGRLDHQVKIRGFRIELGEIENALRGGRGVEDALVIARDTPAGKQLLAFVVSTQEGHEQLGLDLHSHLSQALPEHMLPARIRVLERFPQTPNGKLDRNALLALDSRRSQYIAPRTELEQTLAGIWAEALQVEKVGVHDSFFELGGHSLLATGIRTRIQDALGLTIPLRVFFEGETLERLAQEIEALREQAGKQHNTVDSLEALFDEVEAL